MANEIYFGVDGCFQIFKMEYQSFSIDKWRSKIDWNLKFNTTQHFHYSSLHYNMT